MLGIDWQRLHDERRPQHIVKITSRSASGTTASASSPPRRFMEELHSQG
jgi:hypothetical protein